MERSWEEPGPPVPAEPSLPARPPWHVNGALWGPPAQPSLDTTVVSNTGNRSSTRARPSRPSQEAPPRRVAGEDSSDQNGTRTIRSLRKKRRYLQGRSNTRVRALHTHTHSGLAASRPSSCTYPTHSTWCAPSGPVYIPSVWGHLC